MHALQRTSCGLILALALAPSASAAMRTPEAGLHDAMRQLWEDHITWTRLYIVSVAGNLPDKDATTQRLLRNQADIGNAIKPFYGDAAGDRLTDLLREHILIAAELVTETKAGHSQAADSADRKWRANADAIAAFLSGANPTSWPLDTMRSEMAMHLDLTRTEAAARLQGRFNDDVRAYDAVHEHILHFADMLSDGLMGRVPAARIAVGQYTPPGYHAIELVGPTRHP